MYSAIVLFLLFFFMDRSVFPRVIVNVFRYLPVIGNSSNLWMGGIFFFERFSIVESSSFTWPKLKIK